ncbi:MAG: hypothetical protein ACW97O_15385, partial [Candidatus Thorarchaeota archaeon]
PLFSLLMALPLLLLITHNLELAAESLKCEENRTAPRPTRLCLTLLIIAASQLGISILIGSQSLLLASGAIMGYLPILGVIILRRLPRKPVEEIQVHHRMVVGTEDHVDIKLISKTRIGGLLSLKPLHKWLKVSPEILLLRGSELEAKVFLTPTLSGPSIIKLRGYATDRWGLIQISFELEPIRLYVIPRAKYASWLARRFLSGSRLGDLPLISNMEVVKTIHGLRTGVEYYGSQLYQPSDSLKNIDWKHSCKYNELISKEFVEFSGQSAIVLINLAVGSAEEADKLAYDIIVTAISLAHENIPAALAVYDHKGVKITTRALQPRQLLLQSLRVAQEIVTIINPTKYLNPPDVARLRANLSRIRLARSPASKVLAELLQLEYQSLDNTARINPVTKALLETLAKVDKQSNIVVISQRNHDAEALAFNVSRFTRKGNAVINV